MKLRHALAVVTLALFAVGYSSKGLSQEKTPSTSIELESEVARLRTALAECQSEKASKRSDAIASLRAVKSALSAGANFSDFKKYQIESRIKVDAIPDNAANQDVRAISDLFSAAVTFRTVQITGGELSATQIDSAKDRYRNDPNIQKALAMMKSEDVVHTLTYDPPGGSAFMTAESKAENNKIERDKAHAINAECARYVSQLLIIEALKDLADIKD